MDIPKEKGHPTDAVQCDDCGGHGCEACEGRGWQPKGHAKGRICARSGCENPLPPSQIAVYCSDNCAFRDAG